MSRERSRDQKETKMLTDLPENKNVAAGDLLEPSRVTAWRGERCTYSIR